MTNPSYKLVPVEPTEAMYTALATALWPHGQPGKDWTDCLTQAHRALRDAIAAAPEPKVPPLNFLPLGDNHHNAEACPYCNPNGWKLQPAPHPASGETDTDWPSLKDLDAARAKAYRQGKQWEVTDAIVDDIVDAFWQSLRPVSLSPVPAPEIAEIDKLVKFFNEPEAYARWGHQGDYDQLSTVDTAIRALRTALQSQPDTGRAGEWRPWAAFDLIDLADETEIDVRTADGRTYPHQPYFNFKGNSSIVAWRRALAVPSNSGGE